MGKSKIKLGLAERGSRWIFAQVAFDFESLLKKMEILFSFLLFFPEISVRFLGTKI